MCARIKLIPARNNHPSEFHQMYLPRNPCRLSDKPICPLEVIPYPPFGCSFHCANVYVKAATQSHINCRICLLHLFNQRLLFWRAHGNKHHIRAAQNDITDNIPAVYTVTQVSVPVVNYSDARVFSL